MVNPGLAMSRKRIGISLGKAFSLPKVFPEFYVTPKIRICRDKRKKIDGRAYSQKLGSYVYPS